MSKVWKLHKHFLTSLLLVFLFTFAFGAFMAVNDAMGQTMDNKEDTVANVYISESAFESSYEDAYETMHDAEIKVKELQGLYDEALSTKELLANTSGGDTKRMLSILEKHIKSYKEAEKEFKEAEEKFNELEKKATESKYNSRRRDFMKKRAIFEDPPIQKDAHVAYEHQKQTPKRKSEILTTNQEDNGICQLFTIFFNAASVVTKKSIDMFSKPMMQLLVIAFAIWIALQIVAFVSAPEVRDLKDLVSSIINKSFIIMILVGLLSTGAINFFNNFLSPIYTTGQKLAQTILTADNFEFEKDVLPSYCEGSSNVYDEKKGDYVLANMEKLVIKDVSEAGGYGVVFGSDLSPEQLEELKELIRTEPRRWIAQEVIYFKDLETMEEGSVVYRKADLRAFVLSSADGVAVWKSGLTRFARQPDSFVVNSSQGGGFKDTWVMRDMTAPLA